MHFGAQQVTLSVFCNKRALLESFRDVLFNLNLSEASCCTYMTLQKEKCVYIFFTQVLDKIGS